LSDPRDIDAARRDAGGLEVAIELEHVAQILGAGEPEAAICFGRHFVVPDLSPERVRERRRHLRAGQVLAGDVAPTTAMILLSDMQTS
jgi:hypothetical protein